MQITSVKILLLWEQQLLMEPQHAFASHSAKRSDTLSNMTVQRAIKNEVVFIFNMLFSFPWGYGLWS